jgi:dolichyl-phosphate beta-glucosyltransferase
VQFSLVIPAFNEADRLPPYLAEVRGYLDPAYRRRYEVVVVDDGSTDHTAGAVRRAALRWPQLRLVEHPRNRGKGAAVRTGVLEARGRRVLFADADGATPIAEEAKLAAALDSGAAVAVGSRTAAGPGVRRDRHLRRLVAGGLFAFAARRVLGLGVRDTQCGFKMFDRPAARALFRLCRETGYLFDLEVLALAARMGLAVAEVPVSWAERPGSKVRFVRDGVTMVRGLWALRRRLAGVEVSLPAPERVRVAA